MTGTEPIRVLFCENNVDGTVGGSYFSLLYLLKGLDRARYAPIVVFYTDHRLVSAFRDAGVETHVWMRSRPFTFGTGAAAWSWLRPAAVVLRKALNYLRGFVGPALFRAWFLATRNVSIVHLNNSVLYNHDWMLAARLAGKASLTHERGINARYTASAKFFGKRLDAIVCISEAVRQNMRDRGADFANLVTIHNGLDPSEMRPTIDAAVLRARYGLDAHAPVVGMIGNIKAWKGQEVLIRAIDCVRRVHPAVRCVLVGDTSPADRDYERSLRALVASLHLDDHIVFAGAHANVADFLTMFDVVVHASVLPEPFGRVVLEAMACRKPVIGARDGAIPEIIEDGRTGLMFPPGEAKELGEAVVRLLSDPDEARRFGEQGYVRLVEHFGIARNVAATERVYERLVGAAV